jgi:hypothetical protein
MAWFNDANDKKASSFEELFSTEPDSESTGQDQDSATL